MKKQSAYSKKLIKNGVALFATGLVLIAATFAWFSLRADLSVDNVSANINGARFTIEYYKANVSDTFIMLPDTTASAIASSRAALTWSSTSSLTVDPLYPGEYRAFRIDVTTAENCTLVLQNIQCTPPSGVTAQQVYESIYVNLVAVDGSGALLASTSGTLQQFASNAQATGHISGLPMTISALQTVKVYLDVGMSGAQETLRATGATVRIGSVNVI